MAQPSTIGGIRSIVLKFFLPTIAVLVGIAVATTFDAQTIAERLEPSIVRVIVKGPEGNAYGTGFIINRNGHIVTNAHVVQPHVEAGWEINVVEGGATEENLRPATLIETFEGEDLAVIRVDGLDAPSVVIGEASANRLAKGMTVFTIGYPGVGGRIGVIREASFTTGTVSRLFNGSWSEEDPEIRVIQHSAPTNPGSSGGPIVNACGQVVGVNTERELAIIIGPLGIPIMTDIIQGVFFASHATALVQQLKRHRIAYTGSNKVCRELLTMASTDFPLIGSIAAILIVLLILSILFVRPRSLIGGLARSRDSARNGVGAMASGWRLTGRTGGGEAVEILITAEDLSRSSRGIVIGSDPLCDRPLRDPSVSYRHARLVAVDGGLAVSDMDSARGTKVDASPLLPSAEPTPLPDGSQLSLGTVVLSVERIGRLRQHDSP